MGTFAELTTEQQAVLENFTNLVRAWAGEQARVNNHAEVVDTAYNSQILAILTTLDADEVIPNSTGLAGAQGLLSDTEMVTIVSHLQGILTNYNTSPHRLLWVKAAGPASMIG